MPAGCLGKGAVRCCCLLHLREKQDVQVALSFLSQSAFMLLLG